MPKFLFKARKRPKTAVLKTYKQIRVKTLRLPGFVIANFS